ncbi:PREDICTED: cytochrome P450 2C23-like [Priapulus caudatus]|uniref:Cytochrome P450 2C23-like n=1 Tax=Priapulus caudatus TaxID=37621 RepID=A0ABM1ELR8_PRICU|nr:PREDICTED: cytochrome P450 2C23-like [Priapulus caudatus]
MDVGSFSQWCTALLLAVSVYLLVTYLTRKPAGSPPGPRGLPVVGSLLHLGRTNPLAALTELGEKYGPIFSIYFGPRFTVVLNDYELIKEAFLKQGEAFSGRAHAFIIKSLMSDEKGNLHGILETDGAHWKEQRKFALSGLRDFGMGKMSMEGKIQEEAEVLLNEIKGNAGRPVDYQFLLGNAVSNVICNIVFGSRFEYDHADFQQLLTLLNENVRQAGNLEMLNFLPWLRFIPGAGRGQYLGFLARVDKGVSWVKQRIAEHKKSFDRDNIRDFVDLYIKQIEDMAQNKSTTFTYDEAPYVITNLFAAGTETTATTLRWSLLYMTYYPHVAKKVQEEIDAVIGRGRLPSMKDKPNMPYTEATILELQRLAHVVPLAIPHAITKENTTLRGYQIPNGTMVFANLYAVHRDPKRFPEPDVMKPERFLDENGKLSNSEHLIPFSIGWRVCLGEMLAKMELFLFFTAFLQNFDILPPEGDKLAPLTPIIGLTRSPLPHSTRLVLRP